MKLKTINNTESASFKIQRSEFIAFLYPIEEDRQIKEILSAHNEKYKDATHNCYAYVLGKKQETRYFSDQGEPSGTAGKPILNTLLKHNLTNVLAIVTRYYGGVKLGVRGLIDAYSEVVEQVIHKSVLIDFIPYIQYLIRSDYSVLETLKHQLRQYDVQINPLEFADLVKTELLIPEKYQTEVNKILDDFKQKGHLTILV